MDQGFNIEEHSYNVLSWERGGIDSRLVTHNNVTYILLADSKPEVMCLRNIYDHNLNTYTTYLSDNLQQNYANIHLHGYQDGQRNKNYMSFEYNSTLYFVHSFDPLVILQCELQDGRCVMAEFRKDVQHLPGVAEWHGGTPFIRLPQFDSSISYLGLVHERFPYWQYNHRFVVLTLNQSNHTWFISHYTEKFHLDYPTTTKDFYIGMMKLLSRCCYCTCRHVLTVSNC